VPRVCTGRGTPAPHVRSIFIAPSAPRSLIIGI
jgi:hypothetical protein